MLGPGYCISGCIPYAYDREWHALWKHPLGSAKFVLQAPV
jgi:hypothetical protein